MGKKIYSKDKTFFKVKKPKENYNVVDMYAEILDEKENPWVQFASKFIDTTKHLIYPIKDINQVKVEESISYITDFNDKVLFIKYLMNLKDFNPLTDYIPVDQLGPHWGKLFEEIKVKVDERNKIITEMEKHKKTIVYNNRIGELYIVNNLSLKNIPFDEKRSLDFYIIYDEQNKFFMIKTTPLDYVRMDLSEIEQKLEELLPNRFFRHGGNFFLKNKKGILLSKKQLNKILNLNIFKIM